MTIKQLGGIFGRNPTFEDVTIEGTLTFDGDIDVNSDLKVAGDIETTGNVIIATSGKGIDFSATSDGSGTSTSELFDDYEEGTWTPTIGGVSVGSGNYTKVGALIFIECLITANSLSTTTINGLPYDLVSAQGYGGVSFGRLYNASVLDANGVPCRVRLAGGNINFRNNAVNATDSNFTITTPASGTVRLGINGVARVS